MCPVTETHQHPETDEQLLDLEAGNEPETEPELASADTPEPDHPDAETPEAFVSSSGVGPIDRHRPVRPPLVPKTLIWSVVAVIGIALLTLGVRVVIANTSFVSTPGLVGLDVDVARTRLAAEHVGLAVSAERFSALPKGQVLAQTPGEGKPLKHGVKVRVVVSAGTEDFAMPDVIKDGLALAKGTLESRGLNVQVQEQISNEPSNTVIASSPSPGTMVRTGDTVRITVATQGASNNVLLPFDMSGLTIAIDPDVIAGLDTDPAIEVARKLRSLLEASGAKVVISRSATETRTVTVKKRIAAMTETTATAAIGLAVATNGDSGIVIGRPASGSPLPVQTANHLSTLIGNELAANSLTARQSVVASDVVLAKMKIPWLRIRLGSTAVREDVLTFRDTQWSDTVARDIYRALGQQFGKAGGAL